MSLTQIKKIKVFHFIETLGSGGAERALYLNLKHINKIKFDHFVITLYHSDDHFYEQSIRNLGIKVFHLNQTSKRQLLFSIWRLYKILKAEKADILSTHLYWANIIGRISAKLAGVIVVNTIHNPDYDEEVWGQWGYFKQKKYIIVKLLDVLTARMFSDGIVAVSRYVASKSSQIYKPKKFEIAVIKNPIQFNSCSDEKKNPFSSLTPNNYSKNVDYISLVGRITPQKGQIDLVKILIQLTKKYPLLEVLFVGAIHDWDYFCSIKGLLSKHHLESKVHFIGETDQVQEFLRFSKVFVFPTRYEGMGMALAEAMLEEIPVAAYDVGPISEFVRDGIDGLLAIPNDVNHLSRCVEKLLDDKSLRIKMARSGKKQVINNFFPHKVANEWDNYLMSMQTVKDIGKNEIN
ncbi:glycosyltransferase [Gammaproteobacteria bacterium]|nr:glycosyltransferase [Gammaproteobacteria bacterium]